MFSLEVIKKLIDEQINCQIEIYGEGNERKDMEDYIKINKLDNFIFLYGNKDSDLIKMAYQKSHFLIFMSKSEGWPKVVAESMFWGCLPLTSAVSCIPQMLGNGLRGDLLPPNIDDIFNKIKHYIKYPEEYYRKCDSAMHWSRQFTLERFDKEIQNFI
jgi:glycosyltransferase involved in cell wall biosynthesis